MTWAPSKRRFPFFYFSFFWSHFLFTFHNDEFDGTIRLTAKVDTIWVNWEKNDKLKFFYNFYIFLFFSGAKNAHCPFWSREFFIRSNGLILSGQFLVRFSFDFLDKFLCNFMNNIVEDILFNFFVIKLCRKFTHYFLKAIFDQFFELLFWSTSLRYFFGKLFWKFSTFLLFFELRFWAAF